MMTNHHDDKELISLGNHDALIDRIDRLLEESEDEVEFLDGFCDGGPGDVGKCAKQVHFVWTEIRGLVDGYRLGRTTKVETNRAHELVKQA